MHPHGLYINILIISMNMLIVHAFEKVSFVELPGQRLSSNTFETLSVANKIQCVRACKTNSRCTSVNYVAIGNDMECELNLESTNRTAELIEDERSTFMCE